MKTSTHNQVPILVDLDSTSDAADIRRQVISDSIRETLFGDNLPNIWDRKAFFIDSECTYIVCAESAAWFEHPEYFLKQFSFSFRGKQVDDTVAQNAVDRVRCDG